MGTFLSLLNSVKSLDIDKIAQEAIAETSDAISDLNIDQLYEGLRSDGSKITPNYAPSTILAKIKKGQPFDRVTLRDKGDFWEGIETSVTPSQVITDSSNSKTSELERKYDSQKGKILGLNPEKKVIYKKRFLQKAWNSKIENVVKIKLK